MHDTKYFDVTNVIISVDDINDCTPDFYHSHYSLRLDESGAGGGGGGSLFCLGKVEAYDLDVVNRDSLFYEIKSGNDQDLFHVERKKGELLLESKF